MPRRQGNPLSLLFVFLLPFIITCIFKSEQAKRQAMKQGQVPAPVPVPLPAPVKNITKPPPKKDFLIMEEWNTIIPPENVKKSDFLLVPQLNNPHWYAFLLQP